LNGKSYTARHFAYAVYRVFKKLSGLNAIIVGSTKACCLVAFRKGSPLSIGFASNSIIVSSDLPTLNSYTKSIILLDEGEGALLFMDKKPVFFSSSGKIVLKKARQIEFTAYSAKKGDFSHYMLKEIYEEPDVLARIAKYPQDPLLAVSEMIKNAYGTYFTACGTAAHAGLAATYLFSHIAKRHVNFALGSEFYFLEDFLVPRSLLIVASQSGETMDTLEAVRAAKRHKSKVVALVNVPGSTLTRLADLTLFLMAGPELAVASTKAYVAKLALFVLLSFACADKLILGLRLIDKTAKAVTNLFDEGIEKKIKRVAKKIYKNEHIFIIGRSINYPTALEAALKIKEISYIHAEGFAGGELKHGVIALIEKGTPCLVFVADDESRDNVLANAMELKSRGGYMIGIGTKSDGIFDEFIHLPNVWFASPIVNIIPAQLLAYYLATLKGLNPDRPRNLAKSVVVK
jgi:glucosamine--fructose-6-phosphate aminotransferase (isomerizing)